MQRLGRLVADAVWPRTCMACEARVEEDGLCPACWRDMPFVRGAACDACGVPLPGEHDGAARCDACLTVARPWAQGRAALAYAGPARGLVLRLKHGDRPELARGAAAWMLRSGRGVLAAETLLVPVPPHPLRLLKRRYDQAALLAREMARQGGHDWDPLALRRTRRTPTLDRRGAAERMAIQRGSVACRRPARVEGRHVALVDDVLTTGATLGACTEALHAAGAARVTVHLLARVERDGPSYIGGASEERPHAHRHRLYAAALRLLHRRDPPPEGEGRPDRGA